jgi:Zn-dependent peptidase ImmA (M78 family)
VRRLYLKSKKAKLGYFTYIIHFKRIQDENHGLTDLETKEIWVNNKDDLQIQRDTLFHELLHVASEDVPSLKLKDYEGDREEDTIRFQSPRMMQFLADNKWIRTFLYG